jgi:predicted ribosome quality control (RQC) complex YloA/Tae2 family protein
MTIDTLAVTALCSELHAYIGAKIQDTVVASPQSIALELYHERRRVWLLLSVHPKLARIAVHDKKVPRGVEQATPFLLLMRKYLEGGRISAIEQPALERIIIISIVKPTEPRNTDEDAPPFDPSIPISYTTVRLIIEIMDQRSNIFMVDANDTVIECVKHVNAQKSRRVALPQHPYVIPPIPDKADPCLAAIEPLLATLDSEHDLAKALVATYRGVSPQLAREAAYRADNDPATAAKGIQELFNAPAAPCIIRDEHDQPIAYAAYALTHRPGAVACATINEAIIAFALVHESLGDYQRRRDVLRSRISEHRDRIARVLANMTQEMTRAERMELLRWEGQMIYAYMHTITPTMTELVVDEQVITLEPRVAPSLQAQERFKTYDKAKAALAGLPERMQKTSEELQGIDETLAFLTMADSFDAIESVARDALSLGWLKKTDIPRQARVKAQPPLRFPIDASTTIYVGRNAFQNQHVTFTIGESHDTWLHARGIPGGHVIIKAGGRPIDPATLRRAAALAAHYSSAREEAAVDIDICRRTGVRKIKGGPPGLVSYHAESTIRIAPDKTGSPTA